ncbi:MAG: hypothetical protein H7263_18435 [Candidatus Sericytochromatia bacterium]|nr:hypothetical protein [Candidatus Sericytochromatia bacterium]
MYRILFIDEEEETFEYFNDYVDNSSTKDQIEVITLFPLESKEDTIETIFKINPDAIITDFMLNDIKSDITYNVPYNGVELMESLLEIREDFPFFVLTSFDDVAVSQSDDVNKIYIKNILHNNKEESKAKAKFLDRVINQIVHYKSKLQNSQKELLELIELRNSGKATIGDEERIIVLDHFLESSIDKRSSIPEKYKTLSNFDRLGQLLDKVDILLNKVDNSDGK